MNKFVLFLKQYGLLLLAALFFAVACWAFWLYWSNPPQLQSAGVVASFAIAAVLAAVTWQHAYATEQTLDLLRDLWKAQQEIHIRFGLIIQDRRARVWVRNLGISRFMITKAIITNGDSKSQTLYMHMLVHPDRKAGFFIPDALWERHNIFCDINVKLFYESATQPETSQSKAYNLLISVSAPHVIKIYKGIKSWYAYCPKCQRDNETAFNNSVFNMGIDTNGLENFAQAAERQKAAEAELEATHPEHESQWQATIETVRQHNRTEETESE